MATQVSLNVLQPENVAHGAEITIIANGITIAEIVEMDYDADQGIERLPVLGSRRTGVRQGRLLVKGTIKVYWLNAAARSMVQGAFPPTTAGQVAYIYHSARPFQRYNISVVGLAASPWMQFVNVVFEKDVSKWQADKFTEETISWTAEDILGQ